MIRIAAAACAALVLYIGSAGVLAEVVVLYRHSFGGPANASLHGTTCDVDQYAEVANTWTAHSSWQADGTAGLYSAATLPFVPQPGYIYRLRTALRDVVGDDYWLAVGFTAGSSTASGSRFITGATTGHPWMLRRGNASSLNDQLFAGPGTSVGWELNPTLDRSADVDFEILLDTRPEKWQVQWRQKLAWQDVYSVVGAHQYSANPPIAAAGLASGQTSITGRIEQFGLERIQSDLQIVPNGHPKDTAVFRRQTAQLNVTFQSGTQPSSVWLRLDGDVHYAVDESDPRIAVLSGFDPQLKLYTSRLIISDVAERDAGRYFCVLNNADNFEVVSDRATLEVNAIVGFWPLGRREFEQGRYLDIEGARHADVEGAPCFVVGARGIPETAAQITETAGWATSQPLQISGATGQFSISLWGRWNGDGQADVADLIVETLWGAAERKSGAMAQNHWRFICVVYDGTMGRIYIDGQLVSTQPWQPADTPELTVEIGHSSQAEFFDGALDDIRIYNYALTDLQVSSLFSGDQDCVLPYASEFDVSGPLGVPDCIVNICDLAVFMHSWLSCGLYPECR